ncbi:TPA: hypothetical protein EYP66_16855 [Candidatus Poribacteria bacterium]|nr:hypothetical protein [Candidatus Poribacteria bacterium]
MRWFMRIQLIVCIVFGILRCPFNNLVQSQVKQDLETYFPLQANKQWKYRFAITQMGSELTGIMEAKTLPKRQMNGKDVIPYVQVATAQTIFGQQSEQTIDFYLKDKSGIRLYASQKANDTEPKLQEKSNYILKLPLDEKTRWKHKEETTLLQENLTLDVESRIAAIDTTVTVSAGNFEHCIQVVTKGRKIKSMKIGLINYGDAEIKFEESCWYAPKVGLVKSIRKEQSNHFLVGIGGTMMFELMSRE